MKDHDGTERFDLTVIGAGLAGLQLARLAARGGARVLLVDARRSLTDCVRTTGIFVRRTFEDFVFLGPFLGAPIGTMAVHSPAGRSIELTSPRDEFRVGRMQPLYEEMLRQAVAAGARWAPSTAYASLGPHNTQETEVRFRDGTAVRTRFVAGADGARSRVAGHLGLDRNSAWITGVENVYPSASRALPRFDCWVDPRIAPGYLAWCVDDGVEVHAGVGGDPRRFDPATALRDFEARLRREGRIAAATPGERRGGLIPVGGVLRRIGDARGLLVGDAAGAVSPLTAGGLDACMRLSAHAAAVVLQALRGGGGLEAYDGAAFRSRFASRLAMRRGYGLATRSTLAVEMGFAMAPLVMPLVRHVFFGRGSLPDAAAGERLRC